MAQLDFGQFLINGISECFGGMAMADNLMMRLKALLSRSYRFCLSDVENGPGYLYLPQHPGKVVPGIVGKSVRLRDLIGEYEGVDVNFDFDGEGRLIGVEID